MNWYKISQKIRLQDLYDDYELNDSSEAKYNFLSPEDLNKQFTIKTMSPQEMKNLKTHFGDNTVIDVYKNFATPDQKQIVDDKIKYFEHDRIVLIANKTLLDGYHHVVAGILSNRPVKYIDIYEE
jgi:hypothetical protein